MSISITESFAFPILHRLVYYILIALTCNGEIDFHRQQYLNSILKNMINYLITSMCL